MINVVELIRKKRNGETLNEQELRYLIHGYVNGTLPDYQMSAFLMATYFQGMSKDETLTFTRLMLESGQRIDLSGIPGIKVDKHSTGGVGDKVSLILAPLVASCGVPVPMISGRGLGHTGGTLDKLESIPGFRTSFSIEEYISILRHTNVVMMGQTNEIAPADKKMYALRDVTATVECIPLIAGSIMSKKLAEGIDALVLDIKTGRGAFMNEYQRACELAATLVDIGNSFGVRSIGFITDMNEPLGIAIGNWLEVVESIHCLREERGNNDGSKDLMDVTLVLSGAMVYLGNKASSIEEGIVLCKEHIRNGSAFNKFFELVKTQGGNTDVIEQPGLYPLPSFSIEVPALSEGYVSEIDSFELGMTSILLGAGRTKIDDPIDPKAGIVLRKKRGDYVGQGEPLAILYTDKEKIIHDAKQRIQKSFVVSPTQPHAVSRILAMVNESGIHPLPFSNS